MVPVQLLYIFWIFISINSMFSATINVKSTDCVNLYFPFTPLESAGSLEPVHHLDFLPLQWSQNAGGEETDSFLQG